MSWLNTTIECNTGGLGDYSVPAEVEYRYYAGYKGSSIEPPEAPTATILNITVIEANGHRASADWLVAILEADEELIGLCMLDHEEGRAAAAEARAGAALEDRMLERGK